MKKTWLVTGGAGFIGSNFLKIAHQKTDARLVILDALTYAGNLTNIKDLLQESKAKPHVEFVRGDITDSKLVREVFSKYEPTKIINFAAESHVDRSILGPKAFVKTNIEGVFVLLEEARNAWGSHSRENLFLHVSTDEVYGSLKPNDPPCDEFSPYQPNSPYASSKAASDHLVRAWNHTYGLPTVITNCTNNYGPWQFPEKLIPLVILNALEGKELPVYGDGLQIRDWLHVDDHCEALLLILEQGRVGETYNIGGNCEQTNLMIVEKISDCVDTLLNKKKGTTKSHIKHVTDRPGHDRRYSLNTSKLNKELGWTSKHTLDTSLPKLVQWYSENKSWADQIRSGEYTQYYEKQYGNR